METADMKSQLLSGRELELPLDGYGARRKRKISCITVTINTVLCLITCVATLVCIIYTGWAIGEIEKAKTVLEAMKTENHNYQTHPLQAQQQIANDHNWIETSGEISNTNEKPTESSLATPKETDALAEGSAESDTGYRTDQGRISSWNKDAYDIDQAVDDTYEDDYDYDYTDYDDALYSDSDDYEDEQLPTETGHEDLEETSEDELYGSGDYYSDDEDTTWGRIKRSISKSKSNKESKETADTKSSKGRRKGKGKKCKGKECPKDKKKRREVIPRLAQYDATVSDETITNKLPLYDKSVNKAGCDYINGMKGMLCRSKIFTPIDYQEPLNIFHATDLVSAKKSPLRKVDGSANFEVKSDGILLVFLQITFSTNRPVNGASVVQRRTTKGNQPQSNIVQELQCKQGIPDTGPTSDYHKEIDIDITLDTYAPINVSQSCSIVGLLAVKKGDILQIYSNYDGSSLDLNAGLTYFGVVQLTKG